MLRFTFLICVLLLSSPFIISAQQKSVNLQNKSEIQSDTPQVSALKGGKTLLTLGEKRKVIDLKDDITGCLATYDGSDLKSKPVYTKDYLQVVDNSLVGNHFYIVLLASGQGNCNVQGRCGAATDYTLIWLKVSEELELVDKKAVAIENCQSDVILTQTASGESESPENLKLSLEDEQLKVQYEENRYGEKSEYKKFELVYDKLNADKGFVISEVKIKPSVD